MWLKVYIQYERNSSRDDESRRIKSEHKFHFRDDQIDDAILKLHDCLFEGKCDVAIIEDGHIV